VRGGGHNNLSLTTTTGEGRFVFYSASNKEKEKEPNQEGQRSCRANFWKSVDVGGKKGKKKKKPQKSILIQKIRKKRGGR